MASGREWNGFSNQSATSMLCERIDWRQPTRTLTPPMAVWGYRPSYPLSYSFFYAP